MKEILSQAEIDRLLAAVSSGKVTVKDLRETERQSGFKLYDFRRPNKFTKEQLRTLHMLHENFSRVISNFLSGYLRTSVIVRVASVDQFTYEDFMKSIPVPTVLTAFNLSPLKGTAVMEINPQFLFPVIDLLFGGPGEMPSHVRDLTDIELSVVRKLNERILEYFGQAWKDIFEVHTSIISVETNPRLHQLVSPNEIVAVVTFTTVIDGMTRGLINFCLPHYLLDPVISKLSAHYRYSGSNPQNVEKENERIRYWLGLSNVDLTAIIGNSVISMKELLNLQVRDVLVLDRRSDQDVDLYVDQQLKFKASVGNLGKHLGIQITSLAEGVDNDVQ